MCIVTRFILSITGTNRQTALVKGLTWLKRIKNNFTVPVVFKLSSLPKFMLLVFIRTSEFAVIRRLIFTRKTFCQAANSPTHSGQVKFSQTATKATKVFQLEEGFLRALGFNFHFRLKGVFPRSFF